jgi:hypothetical protein
VSDLLSKSTFIRSLQCLKSLYLYKKHYNLRDEISFEQQAVFDRGHQVGFLARELFPGGVDAGWESPVQYKKSVELTRRLIADQTPVIYEAAFVWNDVLVAVDLLVKEDHGWHIYEVKSSLAISETYIRDAALQYYIIGKSGLDITGISIVHLDKNYIFSGILDLEQLFKIEDITTIAFGKIDEVIPGLIRARKTLMQTHVPDISIGPHCDDPYPCDFRNHCSRNIIPDQSVFTLTELEEEKKWELFNRNIIHLKDLPEDYPLSPVQKIEWHSSLTGNVHIDRDNIAKTLENVKEPFAFLDLQVFRPAIPLVRNAHPYKQIPFGYAIRSVAADSTGSHEKIYLAEAGDNFEEALLQNFINDTAGFESIIVFDKKWELWALKNSASRFPDLKSAIENRLAKVEDLSMVFQNKYFYHPAMSKGYSVRFLPSVFGVDQDLPPHPIGSNSHAGTAFEWLYKKHDLFSKEEIRDMLETYLAGNTLALSLIWPALHTI